MRAKGILLAVALFFLALGCGDDPVSPSGQLECTTADDCAPGLICFENNCYTSVPTSDTTDGPTDITETPDPGPDLGQDPGPPFDPGPPPDLAVDKTPPTVKSVDPKDNATNVAVPFKVSITFTEQVKNVNKDTVEIKDIYDNVLTGTFADVPGGDTFVFSPAGAQMLASPYRVTVNYPKQVILDFAGNKMVELFNSSFTTAPPAELGKYDALAFKYAPNVRIGAPKTPEEYPLAIQYDTPTRLNVDADWDLKNNVAFLDDAKTKKINPTVHYAVLESQSHYFIHYAFFWSKRENKYDGEAETVINDAAGAMVVVEKWPAERPVEVLTWFVKGPGHFIRAFTTTESGIFGGNADAEANDGQWPQAELFEGNRVQSYIPAGRHESCLWIDDGQQGALGFVNTCTLEQFAKENGFNVWELSPGTQIKAVQKTGSNWNKSGSATYELVDMLVEWWPRRAQVDTLFANKYQSYQIKYAGNTYNSKFTTRFVDEAGEPGDGRVPWGVKWDPNDGKPIQAGLAQGMYFIDPALYLQKRHKNAYVNKAFDDQTKEGFSTAWCFNPYVGIDQRAAGDPICPK